MNTRLLKPDILFALLPPEPQLRSELPLLGRKVAQANGTHLILDLCRVEILTSPSIGELLTLRSRLSELGRRLILCNTRLATKCIFRVAGLENVFDFAPDKSGALKAICGSERPPIKVRS
jgi:anti-anti-sigma factor